ncbi:MAG: glycosyltransferase family 4 protein [Lachnospiraceae bacterium]|nr:glycosyltransferase family 4 protein [Lachnospiraceae bacterium]
MNQRKKKIVIFCSSLARGGTERVAVNLAEFMKNRGISVTIVTQYRAKNEYALPDGVSRVFSEITDDEAAGNRIGNFFARCRKLRRIWKEQKPDCILSFIGKNNVMAVLTALFTKIPVVVSVRSEPKYENATHTMRFLAKTLFVGAAGIVVQTKEAKKFFPVYLRGRTVVLKNPLNPDFVRPRFTGERDGNIVAVGRVDSNKNHEMIIRAFSRLTKEFPQSALTIYGEGECRKGLQELADRLGISDRVSLPGAVTDVPEKIYKSSVFVLSSNIEGMPNALLEAMCLGIPVISTDCPCGGPGELIENGVNGFLIAVGDEKALEDRLRLLLKDRDRAERMGEQAVLLQKEYEPDKVNAEWLAYLVSKMGGKACAE